MPDVLGTSGIKFSKFRLEAELHVCCQWDVETISIAVNSMLNERNCRSSYRCFCVDWGEGHICVMSAIHAAVVANTGFESDCDAMQEAHFKTENEVAGEHPSAIIEAEVVFRSWDTSCTQLIDYPEFSVCVVYRLSTS